MSAETYDRLADAVREHVADCFDGDALVTDWYLVAAAVLVSEGGVTQYMHACTDSPLHTLHGLVDLAHRRLIGSDSTEDTE